MPSLFWIFARPGISTDQECPASLLCGGDGGFCDSNLSSGRGHQDLVPSLDKLAIAGPSWPAGGAFRHVVSCQRMKPGSQAVSPGADVRVRMASAGGGRVLLFHHATTPGEQNDRFLRYRPTKNMARINMPPVGSTSLRPFRTGGKGLPGLQLRSRSRMKTRRRCWPADL